jgi:N-acetylglucosamine kinase-like BadF-type ATPase
VTRSAVLAVDGGNSKADVALLALDGSLIGAVRGPTISHQAIPMAIAAERLQWLIGLAGRGSEGQLDIRGAVLGLAGADFPGDIRLLRAAFEPIVAGAGALDIVNDTFAALRAGSSQPSGIVLICGQGINGAAVGRDGRRHRFAGVGDLSGDWGGGGSIGRAGLAAAVRGRDGRGPRTALERTIPGAVRLARPEAVTRAYYDGRLDPDRIGELAPTVFATAAAGDAVARGIVDRLADELVTMASALARRADLVRAAPDVVLAGGVFRTDDDAFHARLTVGLDGALPGARAVRLGEPPVLGAALLALEAIAGGGIPATVEAQARDGLRGWNATAEVVTSS